MSIFQDLKRQVIKNLKRTVNHHLWRSGYVDGSESDESLRLLVFVDHAGNRGRRIARKIYSEDLKSIEGFYKNGVIPDGYGGGIVTAPYEGYCVEDLLSIEKWVNENFSKELARIAQDKERRAKKELDKR